MARLVSVNVGLPREVTWRGRPVSTAIWKSPIEGRRMVRRLNVDGDGQADLVAHGGEHRAVYVYQQESHRYWERELGRSGFEPGEFGENFTVAGLPDDEACIGDRYRIGGALLEVTQPRVTCFKVGMRLEEPRMPAMMVSHGRPGFYLRVIEEGEVGAGDEIVRESAGPESLTVAEASALLYLPGHRRERLRQAASIPALSEGWRISFEALLEQDGAGNVALAPQSVPPAWRGLRPFRVAGIRRESSTITSFALEPEDGEPLPPFEPGQFVTLKLAVPGEDRAVLRTYSLSRPPQPGGYRISVKREAMGIGSGHLHTAVGVDDVIDVGAPRGGFTLGADADAPVVLVSAGVGVTPMLAILGALAASVSTREVWWLHVARSRAEHAFADEARELLARLPNAHAHIHYSRPGAGDARGRDFQHEGRLRAEHLPELGVPREADFYLCGPTAFMTEMSAGLVAWGVPGERIRTEEFGPSTARAPAADRPPHPPAGTPGDGPDVSFARAGLSVPWSDGFASLLELAEACDVPADWSCRTGVCHRCETGLVEGSVRYEPEPLDPPAGGAVLLCCSRPAGEVVLDL